MNRVSHKLLWLQRGLGLGLATVALLGCVALATAAGTKIELPRETILYRSGPGVELANAHCLACHSADYASIQPRMPLSFWQANIKKMREKYGAEIPDSTAALLVNYFSATYGRDQSPAVGAVPAPSKLPGSDSTSPAPPMLADAKSLIARFGCIGCHSADKKIVGPAFNAVAGKYRNDSTGPVKILQQIQHGGGGQWGSVPMPPFPQIPADDASAIARWILTLK